MMRVGIGYDVHRLVAGRKLILGGVEIPSEQGLLGHSDADALLHAITDAVLGAIGQPDIGCLFPNSDPRWKDHPSGYFLEHALQLAAQSGYHVANIDAVLIAEQPKLAPFIDLMRSNIAKLTAVEKSQVNIKATTNEKLGFVGRGEGIAALAVVLLYQLSSQKG